jgi:hypothetical protein
MIKRIGIEEVLATFSSHISNQYQSPGDMRSMLDALLERKRRRMGGDEYKKSLEKNLVFLNDIALEGEAFLDLLTKPGGLEMSENKLHSVLGEMEQKVRSRTDERHGEIFSGSEDGDFKELRRLRESDEKAYIERMEFDYRYLMTFKILLFDFFNVLLRVGSEYEIAPDALTDRKRIMNHIELTVHYFLGNIKIEEEKRK